MRIYLKMLRIKFLFIWTLIFIFGINFISSVLGDNLSIVKAADKGFVQGICDHKESESDLTKDFRHSDVNDQFSAGENNTLVHRFHYKGEQRVVTYSNPQIVDNKDEIKTKFSNIFSSIANWVMYYQYPNASNLYFAIDSNGFGYMFYKTGDKFQLVEKMSLNQQAPVVIQTAEHYAYAVWINEISIDCQSLEEKENQDKIKNLANPLLAYKEGRFPVDSSNWKDYGCDKPPEIVIAGNSNLKDEDGNTKYRPEVTFKLEHVRAKTGAMVAEDNFFYFMSQFSSYSDIAIRINDHGIGWFVIYDKEYVGTEFDGLDSRIGDSKVYVDETIWNKFVNRVYNAKGQQITASVPMPECGEVTKMKEEPNNYPVGEVPPRQCINLSDDGWLKGCWGVTESRTSLLTGIGLGAPCGVNLGLNPFTLAIGGILCSFIEAIGAITQWLMDTLFKGTFNALETNYSSQISQFKPALLIGIAQAQDNESAIRAALRPDGSSNSAWVIGSWKVLLALTDIGLVLILIFLALVNILRIQYDTYAIKKALPILIVGVILANFSLLIVRMLVDFSNIITSVFTEGQTPGEFARQLIAGAPIGTDKAGELGVAGIGLGGLLLWFFFSLYVMVAFLILGFLFYIRFAVVLILAIAAPLAFVAMAFPPTQGLFKQWWGWLSKFVFMKPIVFFMLWLAMKIRTTEDAMGHLTAWLIVATLVYIAIILPFKLGGVVMGAWGKLGQWATGTGKEGYLRKPVDRWWGDQKKAWKDRANLWAERRMPWLREARARHQMTMATLEAQRKASLERGERDVRRRMGTRQENIETDIQMAAARLEQQKRDNMFRIYNEERGRELAEFEASIANSELRLEKRKEDSRVQVANERLNQYGRIPEMLINALSQLDNAREARAMVDPNDTAAVAAAEAAIAAAQGDIATARATLLTGINPATDGNYINPDTGMQYTAADLDRHQDSFMPRLQRTRYMAITNKRYYEDAKDEAEGNSAEALVDKLMTQGAIGPNAWQASDTESFLQGRRTSSPAATAGVATEFAALRTHLINSDTKGVALQHTARMFNQFNSAMMQQAFDTAVASLDDATRGQVENFFAQQSAASVAAGGPAINFDAAGLQRVSLNAKIRSHDALATAVINQLGLSETTAAYQGINGVDANGDNLPIHAGLGRNIARYIERA